VERAQLTIDERPPSPGAGLLIELSGELEMSTAPRLRAVLTGLPADHAVVLDLSRVTFCDSSGLNALLVGHRHLANADGRLVLRDPPPRIRAMLELTGLDEVFGVTTS
jgi:anti-sigma B factor antagonist